MAGRSTDRMFIMSYIVCCKKIRGHNRYFPDLPYKLIGLLSAASVHSPLNDTFDVIFFVLFRNGNIFSIRLQFFFNHLKNCSNCKSATDRPIRSLPRDWQDPWIPWLKSLIWPSWNQNPWTAANWFQPDLLQAENLYQIHKGIRGTFADRQSSKGC